MTYAKKGCIVVSIVLLLSTGLLVAQEFQTEMTKEEWKKAMDEATVKKSKLHIGIMELEKEIGAMAAQDSMLALQVQKENAELVVLINRAEARRKEYEELLNRVDAALKAVSLLSKKQVVDRGNVLDSIAQMIEQERADRLAELQEYKERLNRQQQQLDKLRLSVQTLNEDKSTDVVIIGEWEHDRACLWNIAKQSNVYGNPELWVKIWLANKKKIANPDLIYPGQELRIPAKATLTAYERSELAQYNADRFAAPMKTLTQARQQPNNERTKK